MDLDHAQQPEYSCIIDSNNASLNGSIRRITRDIRTIMKNPLCENGIYYEHDMENIFKGYALIIGPTDTPYQDGFYFFEFIFPIDYPHQPPVLRFLSNGDHIRFNPNLYRSGKVCISMLNTWSGEQWTSCQSISSILLTLCTILNDRPLLNEPGINSWDKQIETYNTIISYKNIEVCILKMLGNIETGVAPYSRFKETCWSHFTKHRDRILTKIDSVVEDASKSNSMVQNGVMVMKTYNMMVSINKTRGDIIKNHILDMVMDRNGDNCDDNNT
jgi:ubiquitin-protein ligase